jgi:hypothetical protein
LLFSYTLHSTPHHSPPLTILPASPPPYTLTQPPPYTLPTYTHPFTPIRIPSSAIYGSGHELEHNSGKHLFNALGYVILMIAIMLWTRCKLSEEKILEWCVLDFSSPSSTSEKKKTSVSTILTIYSLYSLQVWSEGLLRLCTVGGLLR